MRLMTAETRADWGGALSVESETQWQCMCNTRRHNHRTKHAALGADASSFPFFLLVFSSCSENMSTHPHPPPPPIVFVPFEERPAASSSKIILLTASVTTQLNSIDLIDSSPSLHALLRRKCAGHFWSKSHYSRTGERGLAGALYREWRVGGILSWSACWVEPVLLSSCY